MSYTLYQVVWKGESVITYSDPDYASWASSSNDLWGIGARTGGEAGDFFVRNVSMTTVKPPAASAAASSSSSTADAQAVDDTEGLLYTGPHADRYLSDYAYYESQSHFADLDTAIAVGVTIYPQCRGITRGTVTVTVTVTVTNSAHDMKCTSIARCSSPVSHDMCLTPMIFLLLSLFAA
jgi:hypothetical protein